jgi:hypothetical protein
MLAVLVCLLLAGLAMTMLAQSSMRLSTTALERQRELQRRWGIISCQRTMLPAAPRLFAQLQEQATDLSAPAPATYTANVTLGEFQFDLLLADENAKLSMNTVFHHRGRAAAERFANRNLSALYRPPVRLYPEAKQGKPLEALLANEGLPNALQSWGQVFDFSLATGLQNNRWRVPQLTARMTLWGRGQLNVRRASDATIIEACQLVVSEGAARRLQKDFRDKPKHQIDSLVKQLDVDEKKQLLLQDMLTEYSSCFSLWTTARATQVEAQRFSVMQVDEEGVTRTTEFVY